MSRDDLARFCVDIPKEIWKTPHCFSMVSQKFIDAVLETTGVAPVIWGNHPMWNFYSPEGIVDIVGKSYDYERGWSHPEELPEIWSIPENQELIQYYLNLADLDYCLAIMSPTASEETFRQMHNEVFHPVYPNVSRLKVIRSFCQHIDAVKWVFYPLEQELPYGGLLMASPENASLVTSIVQKLQQLGQPSFRRADEKFTLTEFKD